MEFKDTARHSSVALRGVHEIRRFASIFAGWLCGGVSRSLSATLVVEIPEYI